MLAAANPERNRGSPLASQAVVVPPIGPDGYSMEWHHVSRTPDGGVKPMTRTEHRLGENNKKNHPKKDK
jgi:hypothetical protein